MLIGVLYLFSFVEPITLTYVKVVFMNLQNTTKFTLFTEKHKKLATFLCYLIPFAGLGGYLVSIILQGRTVPSAGYYLIHYLYTYDHGFVARGLVGEVLSWFFDSVSDQLTEYVAVFFAFLLMIAASLCIGKALSKTKDNPEQFFIVAAFSVLICLCPAGFTQYYVDVKLDKLTWALALFGVFLADRKYAIWLVPVLCVIATLVNPVFLFTSMILLAIILLYNFYSNHYSVKNGLVCAVSYLAMIALGLYSVASEKQLGFATPNELVDFYFARYDGVLSERIYNAFLTDWLFDYFNDVKEVAKMSFQTYFHDWNNRIVSLLDIVFLFIPTYALTGIFWRKCIKASDNKFQKFIFFLCAVSPVAFIPPFIFSWESSKYFYNNLFVQMALVIFFVAQSNPAVMGTFKKAFEWIKSHVIVAACIAIYFLSVVIL